MPAPPFVAHQPRWLILSAFLFFWSLLSSFRREGGGLALGLGVDARAMQEQYAPDALWRRQVGLPTCAALCAAQAGDAVGCGEGINLGCACHSPSFMPDTVNCMDKNCTSIDEQEGQQALMSACAVVGTSTTSSQTSTSFSVTSTSITSGPPPICTTVSPTSSSATTTVSVTVTVTSASPSSSASVPVVTTTAMETTSSTVLLPTGSTTHPETTVTSTSTLSGLPTATNPTGGSGQTGSATGVPPHALGALFAAVVVASAVWMM
ncbi:hypothetical protein BD413DRAFT_190596 [Trametes elegans]|nr:hypothetical protein BD413DRAFT_190596 [Trametes elegans]